MDKKEKIDKFANYYLSCLIKEKTIYYHSYRSSIMAGNPYAIFKYLMEQDEFKEFEHIWVYKDNDTLKYDTFSRYLNCSNVRFVKQGSEEQIKALATCQYLFENAALPDYWQKKEGQIYINTWHGTPLKSLGRDANDLKKASVSNAQRNFFMCDYLVMPNKYTIEKLISAYGLRNFFQGTVIDAGYPRNDLVINANKARIKKLLEDKCREPIGDKKIVLYAPTFRSQNGKSINTSSTLVKHIKNLKNKLPSDYILFFKVHNTLGSYFKKNKVIKQFLLFDEIETNELLSVTDVLITDYSSIYFDFLCTRKPILFFMYDRKDYESKHGVYLDLDSVPGKLCYTVDEIIGSLNAINNNDAVCSNYENNVLNYAYNDDGGATKRVVDIVFRKKNDILSEYIYDDFKDKKKNIFISIGDVVDVRITQLLRYLLSKIDYEKYSVIVITTELKKTWEICKLINKDISIMSSEISYNETNKERQYRCNSKAFYLRQKQKYFFNIDCDIYIDLKDLGEYGRIDAIVDNIENIKKVQLLTELNDFCCIDNSYDEIYLMMNNCSEEFLKDLPSNVKVIKKTINEHMLNVLCLGGFDSMNYTLAECVCKLKEKGHNVTVVVKDENDIVNNRIYYERNISTISIEQFNYKQLKNVDIVITTPVKLNAYRRLYKEIRKRKIFVCSFAVLFSSIVMRIKPDIVFCLGVNKFAEFKDNYLRYNCIAAGNPQYERIIENKKTIEKKQIEKVLIIDQGGYPFGSVGKKQLADTITRIAVNNPEMQFDIKPRYIKNEFGQMLHKVSEYLFDFFEYIPSNLHLMEESKILEDIVGEYDAMITTWSTSFLDAIILDLPIIFISGLDSVDVFSVRNNRVNDAYNHLMGTGCVYHYSELDDLTGKFHKVKKEFIEQEIYNYNEAPTNKIVECMEYIYMNVINKKKRFQNNFNYTMDEFYKVFDKIELVDINEESYSLKYRYEVMLNSLMQEYVYINRCMGNVLDLSPLVNYYTINVEEEKKGTDTETIGYFRAMVSNEFEKIRDAFFIDRENASIIDENKILQDFYFDWLYEKGLYQEIKNYKGKLVAEESREYYLAKIYLFKNKYRAYTHLFNYIDFSLKHAVKQLLKEEKMGTYLKPFRIGKNKYWFYFFLLKTRMYGVLNYFDQKSIEKNTITTWFKMKWLNDEKNYNDCISLYHRHMKRVKKKKHNIVKKVFRFLVHQEYCKAERIKEIKEEETNV